MSRAMARSGSYFFKQDILCPTPKNQLPELNQPLNAFKDRQKMVAGELAYFAREMDAAVSEKNFCLADAARIQNNLSGRGIASMVLIFQSEVEFAKRNPTPLATPSHMNDPLLIWQHGS